MVNDGSAAPEAAAVPAGLRVSDGHFAEQFPLSPLDDYMIHQTFDPIRVVQTSDFRAYERYWMVCHDPSGDLLVATGGSIYPNLDRAEAYAIVVWKGTHLAVRAFRPLGVDRADMRVGPIEPVIVRGLREWRFTLGANEQGVEYDITFRDTTRQVFREAISNVTGGSPAGRRNDVTTGFEGFGDVSGHVVVGGRRIDLQAGASGSRDRHWGTGRGVGGPRLAFDGRLHVGTSGNAFVAFPSWKLWGDRVFHPFGSPEQGALRVGKPSRWLRFEPDTHVFMEGRVKYPLANGETKTVHYERIGAQTAYLRCGMYGGTPDLDVHQGGWEGPPTVQGEAEDLTDPVVRARLAGLDEHLCRASCDGEEVLGVYQTIDPVAYEACRSGRPGWSFL